MITLGGCNLWHSNGLDGNSFFVLAIPTLVPSLWSSPRFHLLVGNSPVFSDSPTGTSVACYSPDPTNTLLALLFRLASLTGNAH